MSLKQNTRLGPYCIIAPLGAGGMGEVYRAKDTRLDREVAIKVLSERLANNEDAMARFEREAKAVAALSHPNILAIHDVGKEQEISFVVTELLEGETLRALLRRSAVPWRKAVEHGIAIADGMAAAHAKGIIHRDLKPENIFLTKDGVVKILDFGLARAAPGSNAPAELLADTPTMTLDTRPGTVLGTVNYMSPEQISGRMTDVRTDIFSFGCVLYEMISGRKAFGGDSVAETTTAILRDEPPALLESGLLVPAELDRVILRCHEKKPELRIQSARDLSFALRDLLSDSEPSKPAVAHHGLRSRTMLLVQLAVGAVAVVALLLALNVGGWRTPLVRGLPAGTISSLAVLPLENLSRDPEQEYFVDGMTEALISDLAKIGSIKVISRTSVMRYKATTKSLPEIARELNVDAVVEGSVLRVGDRVRITAQLIHAATEKNLWAESYDRDLRNVLRLHSELARTIAQEIKVTLSPQEQAQLTSARAVSPEAHEAYLKGLYHWNKFTEKGWYRAVDFFREALDVDPTYAPAYAGLAQAYAALGIFYLSPEEAYPKGKSAALKAVEFDDSLAQAHAELAAVVMFYERDWTTVERELQRALNLDPNASITHDLHSLYLAAMGRLDEAVAAAKRAQSLDPLSVLCTRNVGWAYFNLRDYDQALDYCQKTLDLDPNFDWAHSLKGWALIQQGRYDEVLREYANISNVDERSPGMLPPLVHAYAALGRKADAERIVDQLLQRSKLRYVDPAEVALGYLGLGDRDRAFQWLETAVQQRSAWWPAYLNVSPVFDSLRSDPRFADLVRRVGLPPLIPIPPVTSSSKPPSDKIMLAVLPFENLSHDPEQDYFSDGLTDEMIARMSRLNPKKLGVIARRSAMHYKNTEKTVDAIGRELGVTFILEGSVRREGDRVRINVQLIQVSDQTQLWAESYERDLKDIFALQIEVTQRVAGSLTVELLSGADSTSSPPRPINTEAYQAYLKGRFYWNKRTSDDLKKAVEYFEQAIALDPDWPLGYAGLADAYAVMPWWAPVRPSEAMPKAKAAATKALQMDESLAEAHACLGAIAADYDWDWPTAEREFERALALSPNYATAHQWYGEYLKNMGRHGDAIRELTKAQELDPLSLIIGVNIGIVHYCAGDLEQAETWLRKTLELDTDFAQTHDELAITLLLQGRHAEAITEAREAVRLSNNEPSVVLAYVCAKAGQIEEARRILDELSARSKETYVAPRHFAFIYAGLDERDRMFEWFERAYQDRNIQLIPTLTNRLLADLRSDPRFADLVRRIGLPPLNPIPPATSSSKPPSEKIMLAVLPFDNLSRDPEQEYFSDGLTDEMIAQVSRLNPKKLGVIARTSALHYKNTAETIDAIGRELGVAYIVEGSVRRNGNRVRITAQLIQVSDQTQLWTESYERDLKDIFDLQIDVAKRIAESLTVELLPGTAAASGRARPINPEAHEAYLKGRFYWNKRTHDGVGKAVEYFEQAIALEPAWPLAYAGLADAHLLRPQFFFSRPSEAMPKAKAAAAKALEVDELQGEAHASLGHIATLYDWDWPAAEREFQRALKLSPNYATAHNWYALNLVFTGRHDEALREITKAHQLDPLSLIVSNSVGFVHYRSGDLEKAETWLRKTLELGPDFAIAHANLARTLFQQGRIAEAITAAQESVKNAHDESYSAATLGYICGMADQADETRKILDQLTVRSLDAYVPPTHFAILHAGLDERDQMFEWFERAYQERDTWFMFTLTDPLLAPLHSDPRFADFVRRVGLPEQKSK